MGPDGAVAWVPRVGIGLRRPLKSESLYIIDNYTYQACQHRLSQATTHIK